jgi:arsenate reductase
MSNDKLKILFLCTGNSCRSQMAEGFARHLKSDLLEAWSAGIERHGMNANAIRVMAEKGVDISGHSSKLLDDLSQVKFDYVITVCGNAHETCPVFSGDCQVVHVGFDDPPKMAKTFDTLEEQLNCYRRVRDEIERYIETLPRSLPGYMEER